MGVDDRGDAAVGRRVVLVLDSRWPVLPGVCCWRHSVHEAFAAAGARVVDVSVSPVQESVVPASAGSRRLRLLPAPVRRPLVRAVRGARREASGALGRVRDLRSGLRRELLSALDGASIVVAESVEAAMVARNAGAPADRVWALALPADRMVHGPDAERLVRAAGALAGFLTDSEASREAVERATPATRTKVVVFPPVVVDRVCPSCADPEAAGRAADSGDLPPEVTQLALWWRLLDGVRSGGDADVPYSFAAARLLGASAQWAPAEWPDWAQETAYTDVRGRIPAADGPSHWKADAQVHGARSLLDVAAPAGGTSVRPGRATLVAGFDLKFVRELAAQLDRRPDLDVTVDEWPAMRGGTSRTKDLVKRSESILAEWARPSAAWLSRQKVPGQFLVVRLHRFELNTAYPRDIVIDNVDAVVHVSRPVGRRIRDELGWPEEKLVYIPNFLDVDWFDRPKLPNARFGIGFVGMEFANKRFDLALDVLSAVRSQDPRFTLFVRSVMPWDNRYAWARPVEREFVGWCLERIEQDPLLRGAVIFEPPGRDMARWYRRVGHVLSMSDIESFHLAAAEGMASGAVPVIRPWPGATEIYDKEWIHSSVDEAAAAVLASVDTGAWEQRAARAKAEIRRTADPAAVVQAWTDLLHGDLATARGHFAERAGGGE